jgi:hypothetical protein
MSSKEIGELTVKELVIKSCERYLFEPNDEITVEKIKNECVKQLTQVLDDLEFHIDDSSLAINYK